MEEETRRDPAAALGASDRAVTGRAPKGEGSVPHVVIVGGGFAGLEAARALKRAPCRVTLLDRTNHHLFQPLLYQVATGGLGAPDIASPLRKILKRQDNATVLMAEVENVSPELRRVHTSAGDFDYDYLVLAAGATHSYFGNDQWSDNAPGLKSLEDAVAIRHKILLAFEAAEHAQDARSRERALTFVVVGAGPTGVELAGAIAEMARHTLTDEFRNFDPARARVVLLDAADRVLPPYNPVLSEYARSRLEKLGVEVRTGEMVTDVDLFGVTTKRERYEADTVLWSAGVRASELGRTLGVENDRSGRVPVEADLTLPGHPEVFVVGDIAAVKSEGKPVPGVAPAAIQQGRHAAWNISQRLKGMASEPFRYVDKGSMATIGRSKAVAETHGVRLTGFVAWIAWLFVHVLYLVGFRNRVSVMADWTWAYLTYQRTARVMTWGLEAPPRGGSRLEAAGRPELRQVADAAFGGERHPPA